MATVTLSYNTRNTKAKNLLNYVISTGLMTIEAEPFSVLPKPNEVVKNGRRHHSVSRSEQERRQDALTRLLARQAEMPASHLSDEEIDRFRYDYLSEKYKCYGRTIDN